ncbi:pantoate--beta-alanine ligase [Adhaeretor mobilis]|uniref:Pantothenate synthetase n=1 Tax=Adhaeretor mobilis TaxID=1930276 RepID=A0A517N2J4_9BACT|nr:pantoate--beta-alanine ligase [Adhaeretor mobilis]QDT01354.1 Pantoate-beta-alanine ligase [Adhaeretor mobilis]
METIESGNEIRAAIIAARQSGKVVGLVPTMGALHQGHLSLVDAALAECDLVAVSIFVNPTQFAPSEDLEKYPRTLEQDLSALRERGCHLVFTPQQSEIYPEGHSTTVHMEGIAKRLEGRVRPEHFDGVATVVLKLFNLMPADRAYFGQKDYQQALVIEQMIGDLNVPMELQICPTIREPDGLAMSSRNAYLSEAEREQALAIPRALQAAETEFERGERSAEVLIRNMYGVLNSAGLEANYVSIVRQGTLTPVVTLDESAVALIAAAVGSTRLIDNVILGTGE